MQALSEYTNEETNRVGILYKDGDDYGAILYRNGMVALDRKCPGHTMQYVEDLIENWINKWGEFRV